MNLIEHSKLFIVNSTDRASGTNSDFRYNLNILSTDRFDRCVVLRGCFPKSYYTIGANESFILDENGPQATIPIPRGSYNFISFKTILISALNTASPNGWTYNVTYPNTATQPDTGKFTYTVTGNGGVQPRFIFNGTLFEQMGFDDGSTDTFAGDTLESINVITMQKEVSLLLNSDIVANTTGDSLLQDIYSAAGNSNYSYIVHNMFDLEAESRPMNPNALSTIYRFNLTDEDGNAIDTNGINMVFTLLCYRTSRTRALINQTISLLATLLRESGLINRLTEQTDAKKEQTSSPSDSPDAPLGSTPADTPTN